MSNDNVFIYHEDGSFTSLGLKKQTPDQLEKADGNIFHNNKEDDLFGESLILGHTQQGDS